MDITDFSKIEHMDAPETVDFLLYVFKRWNIGTEEIIDTLQDMQTKLRDVKYYYLMEAFAFADKPMLEVEP